MGNWGERRGTIPRQPDPQSGALPTELLSPSSRPIKYHNRLTAVKHFFLQIRISRESLKDTQEIQEVQEIQKACTGTPNSPESTVSPCVVCYFHKQSLETKRRRGIFWVPRLLCYGSRCIRRALAARSVLCSPFSVLRGAIAPLTSPCRSGGRS